MYVVAGIASRPRDHRDCTEFNHVYMNVASYDAWIRKHCMYSIGTVTNICMHVSYDRRVQMYYIRTMGGGWVMRVLKGMVPTLIVGRAS